MNMQRELSQIIKGLPVSDGDGVQLTRIIGGAELNMLDPFLLLDAFGSDKPQDYIGGFPAHPHRGFETVTYMLDGKMRHEDSAGNAGVIEAGGVQWMTAGKGIIHSEMPEQSKGLLSGFQLWLNLPAQYKMTPPKYQERTSSEIQIESFGKSSSIKVIAGKTLQGTEGVIESDFVAPVYWDIEQSENDHFSQALPHNHNAFIYVIEGQLKIGNKASLLSEKHLGVLTVGDSIQIEATKNSRYLLIAGKPINEKVERAGPFVMNTKQQLQQAFLDYQNGNLTA